jgi:hypothetical protein
VIDAMNRLSAALSGRYRIELQLGERKSDMTSRYAMTTAFSIEPAR